jgi:hypothetical protein
MVTYYTRRFQADTNAMASLREKKLLAKLKIARNSYAEKPLVSYQHDPHLWRLSI